jgi:hypothetical protein
MLAARGVALGRELASKQWRLSGAKTEHRSCVQQTLAGLDKLTLSWYFLVP